MAARRVRRRALPPLRVDAGEDAERLPSPTGEEGWGTGWEGKSHTQVRKYVSWEAQLKLGFAPERCVPRNGRKRAAESGAQPGGGGNVPTVTSLIPWSPRQMVSLPYSTCAYPVPAPGVHQLSFSCRSDLLASSELAASPQGPSSHIQKPGTSVTGRERQLVFVSPLHSKAI